MKATDILKRLEKARKLLALMPADTDILSVFLEANGCGRDLSSIQLAIGEWERLLEAQVFEERPLLSHGRGADKLSMSIEGFELYELRYEETPAGIYPADNRTLIQNAQAEDGGEEPVYPHCPICGAECDQICRNPEGEIVGCDLCLETRDAWYETACFSAKETKSE